MFSSRSWLGPERDLLTPYAAHLLHNQFKYLCHVQANIIAVQKVFYNQNPSFTCELSEIRASRNRTNIILHNRPMASGDVDAINRFLYRRYLQAFPRLSPVNDLAQHPRPNFPVQHYALSRNLRYSGAWWYLAWTLLLLRFYWLLLLQSVSLS
jgi:hypothetical protein